MRCRASFTDLELAAQSAVACSRGADHDARHKSSHSKSSRKSVRDRVVDEVMRSEREMAPTIIILLPMKNNPKHLDGPPR